ncbi:MAG: SBBP repeat-containing protein [Bryobacteraceae bacterium]
MAAEDRLPGAANYFVGGREQWRTDIIGYGRVRYSQIYPGIDLVFHGDEGQLEYDFILKPGADPGLIRLELSGQRSLSIAENGDLVISSAAGDVRWKRPEIYQTRDSGRVSVSGHYVVAGRTVKFELGSYDHQRELVIDPTLAYATFLGGTRNDLARGIALDGSGNVYIAGNTSSLNLQTVSAFQPNFGGASTSYDMYGDAFVAKFSPAGALLYLTYLGGSGDDAASAIAVDSAGNAYVTGATTSTNFPTMTPYQAHFGGLGGLSAVHSGDAFVTKLNPTGNQLIYSTYLGGSLDDVGTAIAVDGAGNAYVAGATASPNFPTSAGAYQAVLHGAGGQPINPDFDAPAWDPGDAFVVKLSASGQLTAGTYLGGALDDVAFAIALDSSGNIYVAGCTISLNFPTTVGAIQRSFGGSDPNNYFRNSGDGFVTKFNSTLGSLLYSTYFGGEGDDLVSGIAVDSSGNIYMTGSTTTGTFQTSAGAFQSRYVGYTSQVYAEQIFGDGYVAKINPSQTTPIYFSYLGGSSNDAGAAIAIDSSGNAYVTGFTDSLDFPVAGGPLQSNLAGDGDQALYEAYGDAFIAVVNPTATALLYSSYYGGRYDDEAYGIALDANNNVYITGNTVSSNLLTTSTAAQKTYAGGGDGLGGFSKGDAYYAVFSGLVSAVPTITKVANAEGESLTIAPNTWVEVKGSNLAPAVSSPACAPGYCWQGSDFVNNQLPTTLQGVQVTLNGEKAFVYYISGSQINILTPPDLKAGTLTVQVINNGTPSATFTAQGQTLSESFFIFNGGPYIIGEHLYQTSTGAVALVGPTTLYPGLTSPAAPGETIVLYANGFGPTTVPVVSGSETQSGTLPTLPAITIGSATAKVEYAGLISPGLYQFNVVVPATAQSGDNAIQATYNGQTTQAGTKITIQ